MGIEQLSLDKSNQYRQICTSFSVFSENDFVYASEKQIKSYYFTSTILSLVKEFDGHEDVINTLQNLETECLISGSNDRTIKIWDIEIGCCLHTFTKHLSSVITQLQAYPKPLSY